MAWLPRQEMLDRFEDWYDVRFIRPETILDEDLRAIYEVFAWMQQEIDRLEDMVDWDLLVDNEAEG